MVCVFEVFIVDILFTEVRKVYLLAEHNSFPDPSPHNNVNPYTLSRIGYELRYVEENYVMLPWVYMGEFKEVSKGISIGHGFRG